MGDPRNDPAFQSLRETGRNPCEKEPHGYKNAIKDPRWLQAMQQETSQLADKNAWHLVNCPKNAKVLPGLWQFEIKRAKNGNVTKREAHWYVEGSISSLLRQLLRR